MNSDKRKDYYVGLDMGTGSLGGCCYRYTVSSVESKRKRFLVCKGV